MTVESILAMTEGATLDRAVHTQALFHPGKAPAYSSKPEFALRLIEQLPLFVYRMPQNAEGYDPLRPYVAGLLTWNKGATRFESSATVKSATLGVALCKAALIQTFAPKDTGRVGRTTAPLPQRPPPKALDPMPERLTEVKLPTPMGASPDATPPAAAP